MGESTRAVEWPIEVGRTKAWEQQSVGKSKVISNTKSGNGFGKLIGVKELRKGKMPSWKMTSLDTIIFCCWMSYRR